MKAISIKQPWASLIVEGIKDIENRNWHTYYRGPLYIHTGKGFDLQGAELISRLYPAHRKLVKSSKEIRGGIIGHVYLLDCVTSHHSPWFHGKYGLVFVSPKKVPFFPMKGQLSIFNMSFDEPIKMGKRERQLSLF